MDARPTLSPEQPEMAPARELNALVMGSDYLVFHGTTGRVPGDCGSFEPEGDDGHFAITGPGTSTVKGNESVAQKVSPY